MASADVCPQGPRLWLWGLQSWRGLSCFLQHLVCVVSPSINAETLELGTCRGWAKCPHSCGNRGSLLPGAWASRRMSVCLSVCLSSLPVICPPTHSPTCHLYLPTMATNYGLNSKTLEHTRETPTGSGATSLRPRGRWPVDSGREPTINHRADTHPPRVLPRPLVWPCHMRPTEGPSFAAVGTLRWCGAGPRVARVPGGWWTHVT